MFIIVVGQDVHPMLQYGQVKMYNLTRPGFQSWHRNDFNPDLVRISILTWSGFQSWPRNDFNPDLVRISILTSQGFQSWLFSSVDKITLSGFTLSMILLKNAVEIHIDLAKIRRDKSVKIFWDRDYLTTTCRMPCDVKVSWGSHMNSYSLMLVLSIYVYFKIDFNNRCCTLGFHEMPITTKLNFSMTFVLNEQRKFERYLQKY